MTLADGISRYLATSSAQAAFSLTPGYMDRSSLTAAQKVIELGHRGFRGLRCMPFGAGNDNTTFDYKIWGVSWDQAKILTKADHIWLSLLGFGTATLSGVQGADSGEPVTDSERFADTLTWTTASTSSTYKGVGSTIVTAHGLGEPGVFSAADDATPAELLLPDVRAYQAVLTEFDLTGATGANMLIGRVR